MNEYITNKIYWDCNSIYILPIYPVKVDIKIFRVFVAKVAKVWVRAESRGTAKFSAA